MAGRGRGRGGGRGGGRGPLGPVARDDDGTILPTQMTGPPPLYPETELPEHIELSAKDRLLLLRRHDSIKTWKGSPYFLDKQGDTPKASFEQALDRYSERASKRQKRTRPPLSSVMTLIPEYFPQELYTSHEKKISSRLQAGEAYWKGHGGKGEAGGLHRLEKLAALESKAGDGDEGNDEEPVPEERDTDEEEDMEFDDYYQGEHFDDDEGYDFDDDGGGGEEGPVY